MPMILQILLRTACLLKKRLSPLEPNVFLPHTQTKTGMKTKLHSHHPMQKKKSFYTTVQLK